MSNQIKVEMANAFFAGISSARIGMADGSVLMVDNTPRCDCANCQSAERATANNILRVLISGVREHGQPTRLELYASQPDVDAFQKEGTSLSLGGMVATAMALAEPEKKDAFTDVTFSVSYGADAATPLAEISVTAPTKMIEEAWQHFVWPQIVKARLASMLGMGGVGVVVL